MRHPYIFNIWVVLPVFHLHGDGVLILIWYVWEEYLLKPYGFVDGAGISYKKSAQSLKMSNKNVDSWVVPKNTSKVERVMKKRYIHVICHCTYNFDKCEVIKTINKIKVSILS